MIKLVCVVSRPADQSAESFRAWWLGHHAHVAARLPGLRRYTISVSQPNDGDQPPFDGIAELWFDDQTAMEAAFASPEGLACSREDRELIGARVAVVTDEHVIVESG